MYYVLCIMYYILCIMYYVLDYIVVFNINLNIKYHKSICK